LQAFWLRWVVAHSAVEVVETAMESPDNNIAPLAIVLLGGVGAGKPCAGDNSESLEWFPFLGPLSEMVFEADEYIIRRCQKASPKEEVSVDTGFA
jgi:hypothetical protein